jgi:hypothetical protein
MCAENVARGGRDARPNILVVEDEGLIAQDIRRILIDLGCDVPAVAATGSDASP